ncbi:MAG: AAA family ATPase [Dehalococcoidales bacterium]
MKLPISESQALDKEFSDFDINEYQPMSVPHQIRGSILHRLKTKQPVLPDIDGREEAKADVIRALLSGAHPYLISEEGTGKTRLARSLTGLLPGIPIIKGCPYNDDPKWPHELLCPRCKARQNPAEEFGIDFVHHASRFSRIQGNEYTNEAKLLGLKDIQSIAHGKSLSDPEAFTGTGVFRANRGILFVDELPAIRTKIQVLFHPILEEKQAVLEEYNWQHPLDLVFVATGNPTGFSHVNDIPRPLLDRLELVYMDLPDEEVEKKIMLKEGFNEQSNGQSESAFEQPRSFQPEDIVRKVAAPWWIIDIVNKAVRHSRICPFVEKRPSIRATIRALDHTYASVELESRRVANLRQAFYGLRLSLRGRIGLRADLVDFEEPRKSFNLAGSLVEDFLWNVVENIRKGPDFLGEWDRKKVGAELAEILSGRTDLSDGRLDEAVISGTTGLKELVQRMRNMAGEKTDLATAHDSEKKMYSSRDAQVIEEFNYSAAELLANICVHDGTLGESRASKFFIASQYV